MIVRISNEGQYELGEQDGEELLELDNRAVDQCTAGDEERFRTTFAQLLALVRSHGRKLPDDELIASDIILPPPDVSFEEARAGFSGEGLIPS